MAFCNFICVSDAVVDYITPRLASLGFTEANIFPGRYRSHKKTPVKSLFVYEAFNPSSNRGQNDSRVRILLRGNKEADGETYKCLTDIIPCVKKWGCSAGSAVNDAIYRIKRFSGPTREADIDGFPIYTIDLDVLWLSE